MLEATKGKAPRLEAIVILGANSSQVGVTGDRIWAVRE